MTLDEVIGILEQMNRLRKLPADGKGLYLGVGLFPSIRSNELREMLVEYRDMLQQKAVDDANLECEIEPMPLRYPLRDYHVAMSEGPLNWTWEDKPHRLVYDLIAAVRYYAKVAVNDKGSLD